MSDEFDEVPEGAAVFPHIPAELMVDPVLLAMLHATVFLIGSEESLVNHDAADEILQGIADYLQRLEGDRLRAVREDMACLVSHAKEEKWSRDLIHALKTFLSDMGVGEASGTARRASEDDNGEDD